MKSNKFIIILLFVMSIVAALHSAEKEKAIKFLFDGPYHLQTDKKTAHLSILFELSQGKDLEGAVFRTIKVNYDGKERQELCDTFQAGYVKDDKGSGLLILKVTFNPGNLVHRKRYGTYELIIRVIHPKDKWEEDIPLRVIYPETKLFKPNDLKIRHVYFFGIPGLDKAFSPPLYIEVKEGPPFCNLRVRQKGYAVMNNFQVDGELVFENTDCQDEEREMAKLPVKITEKFPMGTSTGTFVVESPEIERTEVSFTVVTGMPKFLILVIAVIGVIVGLIVRVWLQFRIEKLKNIQKIQLLEGRIITERSRKNDTDFYEELNHIETGCLNLVNRFSVALDDEEFSKFKEEFNGLQDNLKKAILDFNEKRTGLEGQYNSLHTLTVYDWSVPKPFSTFLSNLKSRLEEVKNSLISDDLNNAKKKLEDISSGLAGLLWEVLESWYKELETALENLEISGSHPLPENSRTNFKQGLKVLKTKLSEGETVNAPTNNARVEEKARMLLKTAYYENDEARELLDNLIENVQNSALEVERILKPILSSPEGKVILEQLKTEILAVNEIEIPFQLDEPKENIEKIAEQIGKVTEALCSSIDHALEGLGETKQKSISKMVIEGKYIEAVKSAKDDERGGLLGEAPKEVPESVELAARYRKKTPAAAIFDHISKYFPAITPAVKLQHLQLEEEKTRKQIRKMNYLQTFLVAVILTPIAYFIFESSFFGTFEDFLKVFLWGFTTDVGVNHLVEKAKGVAKPG